LLASLDGGIAQAIDVHSLGKLAVVATVKADAGAARPLDGTDFDLTCTTPVAFSVRLRTDAAGRADTFARPGKCLLTSRAAVRIDGKSFSWRASVEMLRGRETRVELSGDSASIQEGEGTRSRGEASGPGPPVDVESNEPTVLTPQDVLPEVVFKVEPKYPPRAKQDRLRGKVVCQAVIGDDGYVRDVTVLSSTSPIFNESSIRAVSQRRYLPAQRSGRAIAVYVTVKVDFNAF
jgi:TonB family protein